MTPDNPHTLQIFMVFINKNIMSKKLTLKQFIISAKNIHGDKYDYSQTIYNGIDNKLLIVCSEHGAFEQIAYDHRNGSGCPKCRSKLMSIKFRSNYEKFVTNAIGVHGKKYDYNKVNYINGKIKVCIICKSHGEFYQIPESHLNGRGCKVCKESRGEKNIRIELENNKIKYEYQKKFEECINPESNRKLPFDFYLPEKNIAIEFNGKQHYGIKHGYFGAQPLEAIEKHKRLIQNDAIKKAYCKRNNIRLIVIDNVDNISKIIAKIK